MSKKNVRRTACSVQGTASSVQHTACTVFLAAVMALPGSLHSQSTADLEAEVRRLEQEVAHAQHDEDSLQALFHARETARFTRVQTGGLQLVTLPQLRDRVETAGRLTWNVLKETYQDSVAVPLRSFPISVLFKPAEDSLAGKVWYPPGTRLVFLSEDEDARGLATSMLSQVTQELWLGQDQALRDWLRSPPPVTTDLSTAFNRAYLDLATSDAPIAQRCLSKPRDCTEALGLSRPPDPGARWYSPLGRRRVVRQLSQRFQVGASRQAYDRCLAGSDQSCRALLSQVPDQVPGSLQAPTRATFLRVVLEQGGAASYPALLASVGEPFALRLERAGGGRLEAAVAEWHQRVMAARPQPTAVQKGQSLAAIGWAALLLLLALRSSRWR